MNITKLKSIFLSLLISFFILGGVGMAKGVKDHVEYFAQYSVNNMFCAFKVNGITYQISSLNGIPKLFSFGGTIGSALAEGENTIGIKGMAVAKEALPNTYCEMLVSASSRNPETGEIESHKVTDIRITVDEDGNFTVAESGDYGDSPLTSLPTLESLKTMEFDDTETYDVLATRKLKINHQHNHHYQWTTADKFTDTPENREKLWRKYEAMIEALNRGDFETYQAHLEPGALESDRYKSDPKTRAFTESVMSSIRAKFKPGLKVDSYDRSDYVLKIYAEGRLFKFIKKSDSFERESPLIYDGTFFNYTFTMINGKIVGAYL